MRTLFLLFFALSTTYGQAQIVDLYKMPDPSKKQNVLRHVVLFKFKADAPSNAITEVERAFASLPSEIPEIKAFEWGINNSPEGLNKGFTHSFILSFASETDRDTYLPHLAHQRFGELVKPWLEDVLVVDYWTEPSKD